MFMIDHDIHTQQTMIFYHEETKQNKTNIMHETQNRTST